jgi:acetyl-CoA/propionyl-CoA carboxylase biotin carboxyl carrier protein
MVGGEGSLPGRLLVANRGEIAVRIIQACREAGISPVVVYSEADADALHVRLADEAVPIGPARPTESYLNVERLLDAARRTGSGAVHPGYGFLAENAAFAAACEEAGLIFVGPPSTAIAAMGNKVAARRLAHSLGLPLAPGSDEPVESIARAREVAARIGYPLAIKAAAGGGGRGLKVVAGEHALATAFEAARREGQEYFGNPEVFIERYLERPRHVEVQVLADNHGTVLTLGERDCSIQRNHQKLIEETPADLSAALRREMAAAAAALARAIDYRGAGTVEFMVASDRFYFLEMNTRIQVEHTVTEMVTGVDLVAAQLRIAAGEPLSLRQEEVVVRGHAIQCRINAEDPAHGFRPGPGLVRAYRAPTGAGIRVDTALYSGYRIPSAYDSLAAKLIAWGEDRDAARRRMHRALAEFVLDGVPTTIPFHRAVMSDPAFAAREVDTGYLARFDLAAMDALPAALTLPAPVAGDAGLRVRAPARAFAVRVGEQDFTVEVAELGSLDGSGRSPRRASVRRRGHSPAGPLVGDGTVRSPMAGVVVRLGVAEGALVEAGHAICVVEAMKMENDVASPFSGVVRHLHVAVGAAVEVGAPLAEISAAT